MANESQFPPTANTDWPDSQRFDCDGLDLARPIDSIKPGRFPFLQNVRTYTKGQVEPRLGLTDEGTPVAGQSPLHSIRRLNNLIAGTYAYILGTGTHLAYGVLGGPYTDADSGYSGNPLALTPWRPEASPASYMYVADSSRMRKISVAGVLDTIGYAPPTTAPGVALANSPSYKVVDGFTATAGWAQGGTAGAPALLSAGPGLRVNTTIAQILYDTGTTGWACVNPTSAANIGQGSRLIIDAAGTPETITVQSLYPGAAATTIARIIYDTGTSGLASLILTTPVDLTACDAIIRNTTVGPENARILSVTKGPDGTTSIRISTTNTWAATNAVTILATYRAYYSATHAAAETITEDGIRTAITSGTGTLTKTSALDLSLLASGIATHPDDYMHISMRVSDPTVVTELKVLLDVDSTTNDFAHNFYWRSFRVSDLTPAASNLQSLLATRQQILQRGIIDTPAVPPELAPYFQNNIPIDYLIQSGMLPPDQVQALTDYQNSVAAAQQQQQQQVNDQVQQLDTAISQQLDAGVSQWVELRFRLADLIRVGTDNSRSLANVAVIRITALVTGNVNLDMDSWWIGGGYGPDSGDPTASAYFYRYRARNTSTNVPSNFSPAVRYQTNPLRQQVVVTPTQYAAPSGTTLTAADFVLDIERFGGQIADWHYIGTIPNAASPSFTDIYTDDVVGGQPILANNNYQPWPVIGLPVSGTTGTVAGTTVNDAATNFNTSWSPGTRILINNQPYTIYRVISTSRIEIVENAGSQSAVSWRIDEPVVLGQPLACFWGDEEFGAAFACGDSVNPGRLYYTNPNNPDTTIQANYLDITSSSEPLQNGVVWNGRSYVWSSERLFQILRSSNPASPYYTQEIPGGLGLYNRWGLARNPFSPFMSTLGKDGIYKSSGAAAESLTDDDLYPLFPSEGNLGTTVNTIAPPNIVAASATKLRMEFYDNYLYFDYINTSNVYRTLAYNMVTGGWFYDVYTPQIVCHYGGEGNLVHELLCGGADGKLYLYGGNSDAGTAIACAVTTPYRDQAHPRLNKFYTDVMVDVNPQGINVTCTPSINNGDASYTALVINDAVRAQNYTALGAAGSIVLGRNLGLAFTFSVSTASRPVLYIWQISFTYKTDTSGRRYTDWDDAGTPGTKYIRGLIIEADTFNVLKSINIRDADTNAVQQTLAVTADGQQEIPFAITTPFNAHLVRLEPVDTTQWRFFKVTWIYDPYPELRPIITTWEDAEFTGAKYVRGLVLEADTNNSIVSVDIQGDSGAVMTTISAQHNGLVEKAYAFTPFVTHNLRFVPAGNIRVFKARWIYDQYPELAAIYSPIHDNDYKGAKFVQGVILRADTANLPVSIQILGDEGVLGATIIATHNGQSEIPYSFTPFVAHELQLVPASPVRFWPDSRWVYEPYPEIATTWQTEGTTHGGTGYQHLRHYAEIALISTAAVTFAITVDGIVHTYTIPSTTGVYTKVRVFLDVLKGKVFSYSLTSSAGFRLFKSDCEIGIKDWGSNDPYRVLTPFGGPHNADGAAI